MNKKERLKVYKKVFNIQVKQEYASATCVKLTNAIKINYLKTKLNFIQKTFPEFYLFKPDDNNILWWASGNVERLMALQFCIEMCKD